MSLRTATADWLDENIDSHGIYDVSMLDTLPKGLRYDTTTDTLSVDIANLAPEDLDDAPSKPVTLHSMSAAQFAKAYGAVENGDPKGAYLDEGIAPETRMIGGYVLAAALDRWLTGEDAGGSYFGRGSAFRANVAHLREGAS